MAYLAKICKKKSESKKKGCKKAPENEVFRGFLSV